MTKGARQVQQTYLLLLLFNTLAASLIWGINTLFLLDAGLSNFEAFAANAFFTAGMMLFEVPIGVVADLKGRRMSYLLGTITLAVSTLLYLYMWQVSAPFWAWAGASLLLGLGFTFFTGAFEAWLVDALRATNFKGRLESVFAKGQIVQGVGMLAGSIGGGVIAQFTNLGVPYIARAVLLGLTFLLAYLFMRDLGFTPAKSKHPLREVKHILHRSVEHGLKKPAIRWVMIAGAFTSGVGIYASYALQPHLLELYGDEGAYTIAGLAAALFAASQIVGGLIASKTGHLFKRRTTFLLVTLSVSAAMLIGLGLLQNFWVALVLLTIWGLTFAAASPIRQAYLNEQIASRERATVLSFDTLLGSGGGVVIQPVLGRVADIWSYPTSYIASGAIQALAIPFVVLAKQAHARADRSTSGG